uniref:Uncharacterized protein n=1 Tax=Anopheles albimanus TaxID=7167 RepID=A0A182FZH4_ANOAL
MMMMIVCCCFHLEAYVLSGRRLYMLYCRWLLLLLRCNKLLCWRYRNRTCYSIVSSHTFDDTA